MSRKKDSGTLRWGYSTGACAAATATAAWERLTRGQTPACIELRFLDGKDRLLPLVEPGEGRMAAICKDGGDDPDCTHRAVIYANIRACAPDEAGPEDYTLAVGKATVILRGVEGVGLCTRPGLECEQGRWAFNSGPRRMIVENLGRAGLDAGCWLLEIGVENGRELASHTLNPRLGIKDGISILGATGLVRPYSHEAYIDTVRICVKSHHITGGSTMVFCTGGRTKSGAQARLGQLPETAFVCIGDFIAESLAAACCWGMNEIIVACMGGKLCKYAAGFENTHAHKVEQDMDLLRAEVRRSMPTETALHDVLQHSVSVREALLLIPEDARQGLLRRLARVALEQFARRCEGDPALRLLVFDFDGEFLFEEAREAPAGKTARRPMPAPSEMDEEDRRVLADAGEIVGPTYFMQAPLANGADEGKTGANVRNEHEAAEAYGSETTTNEADKNGKPASTGRIDVISCGIGFPADALSLELLKNADAVYGSRSLLAACPIELKNVRIIASQAREDAAKALDLSRAGRNVVVLASGDALYHGFGGTLCELRRERDNIVHHPGVTAFQALFHRLGLPWQGVRLFSVHSGGYLPARAIAEAPLSVTYAGSRYPADAIARAVLVFHPASGKRAAVIAERLGSVDERVLSGPLEDLANAACGPTSILALFPDAWRGPLRATTTETVAPKIKDSRAGYAPVSEAPCACAAPVQAPILALGLPEDNYERENNLITASDVRAVILARLRLPAWGVMWDIGAGSGSVGLEAAALRPGLAVHGVERKMKRGAIIESNRLRMGVANYTLHLGDALDYVNDSEDEDEDFLPAPDRVFIGGGGEGLPGLLAACLERLRPNGIVVASVVTLESFAALLALFPEQRAGLCRLDVANERSIAGKSRHLKHLNTIYIFTFQKGIAA